MSGHCRSARRITLLLVLLAAPTLSFGASDPARPLSPAELRHEPIPSAAEFSGPRDTWHRLATALRKGNRNVAMSELTPAAQERYAGLMDEWLTMKPFDENRFGKVSAVTLRGGEYATVKLTRKKNGATYGSEVMMMRGHDGKWRIDRMPTDDAVGH